MNNTPVVTEAPVTSPTSPRYMTRSEVREQAKSVATTFKPGSQNALILAHLVKRETITQVEAHELYRIYRLASRIDELKNHKGIEIARNTKRDVTGRAYVEYSLGGYTI